MVSWTSSRSKLLGTLQTSTPSVLAETDFLVCCLCLDLWMKKGMLLVRMNTHECGTRSPGSRMSKLWRRVWNLKVVSLLKAWCLPMWTRFRKEFCGSYLHALCWKLQKGNPRSLGSVAWRFLNYVVRIFFTVVCIAIGVFMIVRNTRQNLQLPVDDPQENAGDEGELRWWGSTSSSTSWGYLLSEMQERISWCLTMVCTQKKQFVNGWEGGAAEDLLLQSPVIVIRWWRIMRDWCL